MRVPCAASGPAAAGARGVLEVVDRDVDGVARAGDGAHLLGLEVPQRLGVAVEADAEEDRLLRGAGVEVLVVGLHQRHDVLVARVPELLARAACVDREDLARAAGAGVDDAGLGVEHQRPDVVGPERGERPHAAGRVLCGFGIDGVRAARPAWCRRRSVPSGRATSAVTQAASSVATLAGARLAARDVERRRCAPGRRCRSRRSSRRPTASSTRRTPRRAPRAPSSSPARPSPSGRIMLAVASPSSKSLAVVWRKLLLVAAPALVDSPRRATSASWAARGRASLTSERVGRIGGVIVKEARIFRSGPRDGGASPSASVLTTTVSSSLPLTSCLRREDRAVGDAVGVGARGSGCRGAACRAPRPASRR